MNPSGTLTGSSMQSTLTVLLVDDNADFLRQYASLQLHGCVVVTAFSGSEALKKATIQPFDAVVTDFAMPGMNGIQLCEGLKADVRTRHLPVFLLSAYELGSGNSGDDLPTGFDAVLLKPCMPDTLCAVIRRVINGIERGEASGVEAS